jgi:hypothetical protein
MEQYVPPPDEEIAAQRARWSKRETRMLQRELMKLHVVHRYLLGWSIRMIAREFHLRTHYVRGLVIKSGLLKPSRQRPEREPPTPRSAS